MASGYGAFSGISQCYRFWQGFTECRVRGTTSWEREGICTRRHTSTPTLPHLIRATTLPNSHPTPHPQATASAPVMCLLQQADYQECLHREKLKRRIASKALEVTHKLNPPAAGDGHH